MDYERFKELSLEEQANVVKQHGVFLEWKMEGPMMIKLFRVLDFFTEVYLNSSEFKLYAIRAYTGSEFLAEDGVYYQAIPNAS
ncbi:MAG: hypothetical protein ACFCUU_00250 [Cyclobacteriaceae bacterium]